MAPDGVPVLVDLEHGGGDAFQEDTVVGDGDDRAAVRAQPLLQPVDGLVVEVVGGFVEEQQLRGGCEDGGERQTGAPAARECAESAVGVERFAFAQSAQDGGDPAVRVVAAARVELGEQPRVLLGSRLAGRGQGGLG